jgi:hypothetical protein
VAFRLFRWRVIEMAFRCGATTLEGVPDEDALSSQSYRRAFVPTAPIFCKEAQSRLVFSSALAT